MKRVAKGKFGYTLSHRKWQILKMSLYIVLALAVFLSLRRGFVSSLRSFLSSGCVIYHTKAALAACGILW